MRQKHRTGVFACSQEIVVPDQRFRLPVSQPFPQAVDCVGPEPPVVICWKRKHPLPPGGTRGPCQPAASPAGGKDHGNSFSNCVGITAVWTLVARPWGERVEPSPGPEISPAPLTH